MVKFAAKLPGDKTAKMNIGCACLSYFFIGMAYLLSSAFGIGYLTSDGALGILDGVFVVDVWKHYTSLRKNTENLYIIDALA